MNNFRKDAAVKKFAAIDVTPTELLDLIKQDERAYTADEQDEILVAIIDLREKKPGGVQTQAINPAGHEPAKIVQINPNADFLEELAEIDYTNLTGDAWDKYQAIEKRLQWSKMYDFQQYKAEAVKQARYPGLEGTPFDMRGIKLKNDKPNNTTRITPRTAADINAQIVNMENPNGLYLLLKK